MGRVIVRVTVKRDSGFVRWCVRVDGRAEVEIHLGTRAVLEDLRGWGDLAGLARRGIPDLDGAVD